MVSMAASDGNCMQSALTVIRSAHHFTESSLEDENASRQFLAVGGMWRPAMNIRSRPLLDLVVADFAGQKCWLPNCF